MADVLPFRSRSAPLSSETPDPPDTLGASADAIWRPIVREWVLGPDALPLLQAAAETWDRYQAAASLLADEGVTVTNPDSGLTRLHPAHTVARDNLREFRQLFRQLALEPPREK